MSLQQQTEIQLLFGFCQQQAEKLVGRALPGTGPFVNPVEHPGIRGPTVPESCAPTKHPFQTEAGFHSDLNHAG